MWPASAERNYRRLASKVIDEEFVEMMICPACKAKVRLKADGTALKCTSCRRVYRIEDDIPDMRIESAVVEDEEPAGTS